MKKKLIISFVLLIIGIVITVSGKLAFLSTEYIPAIKENKFEMIENNWTREKVLSTLGQPFVPADVNLNCDYFSRSKNNLSDFFGWEAFYICYDIDNQVLTKSKVVFFN